MGKNKHKSSKPVESESDSESGSEFSIQEQHVFSAESHIEACELYLNTFNLFSKLQSLQKAELGFYLGTKAINFSKAALAYVNFNEDINFVKRSIEDATKVCQEAIDHFETFKYPDSKHFISSTKLVIESLSKLNKLL